MYRVNAFNDLVSLLIADRLNQTLSEGCLRYVLSIEASTEKQWLGYDKLAEVVDMANHVQDKPRIGLHSEHRVVPGKRANVNAPSAAYVDVSKTTRGTGIISTAAVAPAGAKYVSNVTWLGI